MKKVLFVASVAGHINAFHLPYLSWFKENGFVVDVATMKETDVGACDNHHKIDFERNPLKPSNLRAYKQLKKLINEGEYDIIHCHTPVAAMLTRIAARKARKSGTKVIYTAHGFHFYKGASLLNWLVYYPLEKLCSRWTDTLIAINEEDFELATRKLKAKKIEYVPGVGVDVNKFVGNAISEKERAELRSSLGVSDEDIMILSVGELCHRKNHEAVIKAIKQIENKNIRYFICGTGALGEYLQKLIDDLSLTDKVKLLGHRKDISALCNCADLFAFPSKQEGLPVALMEAMACGVPCVASKIRGNVDLIKDGRNGRLVEYNDVNGFVNAICEMIADNGNSEIGENNFSDIKKFGLDVVKVKMCEIYSGMTAR